MSDEAPPGIFVSPAADGDGALIHVAWHRGNKTFAASDDYVRKLIATMASAIGCRVVLTEPGCETGCIPIDGEQP